MTKEEAKEKVFNLTVKLLNVRKDKKATMASYKDQEKDLQDEINEIIDEQKNT